MVDLNTYGGRYLKNILSIDVEDWYHILDTSSTPDINEWNHSSYLEYLHVGPRYCRKRDVLDWFGDMKIFKYCHTLDPESDIE